MQQNKKDPESILNKILTLIDDDVTRIGQNVEGMLSSESAFILCRYAEVLGRTVKTEALMDESKTKKLATLTTEELQEKAKKLMSNMGKNQHSR